MKISVITVCLNAAQRIEKTVASVLGQSHPDLEYIVVDGGSTDGTVEIVRCAAAADPRIVWVSEPDAGISDAMNKGVRLATGHVVAHLHADEYYLDRHVLSEVVARFEADPQALWLTGGIHLVDGDGRLLRRVPVRRYSYSRLIHANVILHAATFIRREAFLAAGGFDLALRYCMDYNLWLRLGSRGAPLLLDRELACFSVHGGSRSTMQAANAQAEEFRVRLAFLKARGAWLLPYRIEYRVRKVLNRIFMKKLINSARAAERGGSFMLKNPMVSVVIPCYNHGAFLDETVASVLAQTYPAYEILIVNDGSTDADTVRLLKGYDRPRTTVIHTPNSGVSSARNTGIGRARGEYILPLDADDRIAPTYLEKAVAILAAHPEVGIVYCDEERFGEEQGPWNMPEYDPVAELFDNLIHPAAMFRKGDWERVGGYCSKFVYGWEDWDFWVSMSQLNKEVSKIPEVLYYYRVRSVSRDHSMRFIHKVVMMSLIVLRHKRLYFRKFGRLLAKACLLAKGGFG